jgi:hypothetical protein
MSNRTIVRLWSRTSKEGGEPDSVPLAIHVLCHADGLTRTLWLPMCLRIPWGSSCSGGHGPILIPNMQHSLFVPKLLTTQASSLLHLANFWRVQSCSMKSCISEAGYRPTPSSTFSHTLAAATGTPVTGSPKPLAARDAALSGAFPSPQLRCASSWHR